jgi:hypothetical protein
MANNSICNLKIPGDNINGFPGKCHQRKKRLRTNHLNSHKSKPM